MSEEDTDSRIGYHDKQHKLDRSPGKAPCLHHVAFPDGLTGHYLTADLRYHGNARTKPHKRARDSDCSHGLIA